MAISIVGKISPKVQDVLGISIENDDNIYLGDSNISHMQKRHIKDYEKYGEFIPQILQTPDYVGKNPSDQSIEYVKEFHIDNEYVKVAVRISAGGKYFARSLYVLNDNRVRNFINNGTLHQV